MQEIKQKVSNIFFYLIVACYMTEGIVDVIVGSSWPIIAKTIRIDISFIGVLTMFYYLGAIITSPSTYKIRHKLGTNYTMVLTHVCFGVALVLYIVATNIYVLLIGMFINGMGCGLMEVNAHSYVLKAYDVKGEAFLSSFWGVGSVIGSTVMAVANRYYPPYQKGFVVLIIILVFNIILLLYAKSHWVKKKKTISSEIVNLHSVTEEEKNVNLRIIDLVRNKKIVLVLICFFLSQGVLIALNSLVSTIIANQGKINESKAIELAILFFVAIFIGRMVFGYMTKKENIIVVLKANTLIVCIILMILSICPLDGIVISTLIIILGFIASPIIPFLNAYIKETFDVTLLSALLGYGDVSGVIGIIIMSGLTSLILSIGSIQKVEVFFTVFLFILFLVLIKIEKISKVETV